MSSTIIKIQIAEYYALDREVTVPEEQYAAGFDDDIRHRFADFIRDLYWYDPLAVPDKPSGELYIFPQSQWYLKKSGTYAFAVKGGHNNEPHNHNDIGSFIIFAKDAFIIDDLGWPEYDHDYFGKRRYESICASSAGHSVPVLNDKYQEAGYHACSSLLEASEVRVSLDMTKAYPAGTCKGLIRTFRMEEQGVVMEDEITGITGIIRERFITRICPLLTDGVLSIGSWFIRCSLSDACISVEEALFSPRLSICRMDMKPVETAYLIDFIIPYQSESRKLCFNISTIDS